MSHICKPLAHSLNISLTHGFTAAWSSTSGSLIPALGSKVTASFFLKEQVWSSKTECCRVEQAEDGEEFLSGINIRVKTSKNGNKKSSCATTKNEYSQYLLQASGVVSPVCPMQFLRCKVNDRRRRPRINRWVSMTELKSLDHQGYHGTLLRYGWRGLCWLMHEE